MESIDNSLTEAIKSSKETGWQNYYRVIFNHKCADYGQAMEFLLNSKAKTVTFCRHEAEKLLQGSSRPNEESPRKICRRVELYKVKGYASYDRLKMLNIWLDGSVSAIQVAMGGFK